MLEMVNSMPVAQREDYLLGHIRAKVKEMANSPSHKIKTLFIQGGSSFYCPVYCLAEPSSVALKFHKLSHLPTFTAISHEDKFRINQARASLYSLLIPIHNRKKAMEEFLEFAVLWNREMNRTNEEYFESFKEEDYPTAKRDYRCVRLYTREIFLYPILNQSLRLLKSPLETYYIRLPFQDIFLSIFELYHGQSA